MSGRGKGGYGLGKRAKPANAGSKNDTARDKPLGIYLDDALQSFQYGSPEYEMLDSMRDLLKETLFSAGDWGGLLATDVDLEVALRNATMYNLAYENVPEEDERAVEMYEQFAEPLLEVGEKPEGIGDDDD